MTDRHRREEPDEKGPTGLYTSIEGVRRGLAGLRTAESDAAGRAFEPDPTDVFIATYPKCGTTWTQQIVHSLRTRGDQDYEDIGDVVPWLESCLDLEQDPYASQRAEPRAFKTHFHAGEVPSGGRYINVVRDPRSVLVSFYRFFEGWYFEPGSIEVDAFADQFFLSGSRSGRYWDHVVAWWARRSEADTLLLDYETMRADPERAVRTIAAFVGFGEEEDRIRIAVEQSSLAYMRANDDKYDDKRLRRYRNAACRLPREAGGNKVGGEESARSVVDVSPRILDALEEAWRSIVTPKTGLADYEALRQAMAAR